MSDDPTPPHSRQHSRHSRATRTPPTEEKSGVFSNAVKDIQRLREITSVLAKHGFAGLMRRAGLERILGRTLPTEGVDEVDASNPDDTARHLRMVLQDLGTTFIKLGQILSTRHDLLPQAYISEFEKLQDQVPPLPFAQIRVQIEEGLGGRLDDLYQEVDREPLATASIGQVHTARTREGRRVVIKVQRPGIAGQLRSDLDILYFLCRLLEATVEEADFYSPSDIIREFDRAVHQEIDFLHEARNLRGFRNNFADDPHVVVPEVLEDLSSRTILTMEHLEGDKLSTLPPGSPEAEQLVSLLMDVAYRQIFVHGLFHGDPHPGNILILGPGKVGLLDFGLVGHLSRAQQDDLVVLLIAMIYGDVDSIARTILRMGHPQGRVNLGEFKREIARLRDRYLNRNLGDIDIAAFTSDLMEAALRFQIRIGSEYAILVKATVTVEGMLRKICPDMDLVETASPLAKRLLVERYSSQRMMQELFQSATSLGGFLREVPAQMDQILMDIESGTVAVNVRNDQFSALGDNLARLGTRLFLGLVCAGMIIGGALMLAQLDITLWHIPLAAVLALGFFTGAGAVALIALAWPWIQARMGRVRLTPVLSFLKRRRR